MIEKIRERTEGKNVLILGFGREGKSTFRLLRSLFPQMHLTIGDANTSVSDDPLLASDNFISYKTGESYLHGIENFDLIIKSPGISFKDITIEKEKVTSQTDLFLNAYGHQVIGITGTKGKSTTSTLIHHILQYAEKKSILLGNIGRPAFDHIEEIDAETVVVYEMSSHQLEYLSASPSVGILLNFFQEHLDAYKSYLDYRKAKWNISLHQKKDDVFIINADDPYIQHFMRELPVAGNVFSFSMFDEVEKGCFVKDHKIIFRDKNDEDVFDLIKKRKLNGDHNIRNIMAAFLACLSKNIDPVIIAEAVAGFRGLEHRLEDCGIHGGIRFFNDSIATIPEACMAAVKALGNVDTILLGGYDRGIDYSQLGTFLSSSEVKNIILTGEAGESISSFLIKNENQKVFRIGKFDEFIDVVKEVTAKGKICLLSPAAASYDEFPNFEIRGRRFKELIQKLDQ